MELLELQETVRKESVQVVISLLKAGGGGGGRLGGSAVEHLPSAQGVIPESRIKPYIGLLVGSLLLPLPVSLLLSLCVSHE